MNEIVIRASKRKSIGLSIMSLVMLMASLFNLFVGLNESKTIYMAIGILGIIFFGFTTVYIVWRTLNTIVRNSNTFLLKINEDGIIDNTTMMSIGLIRWEDIKSVRLTKSFTEKFIGIEVKDIENFIVNLPNKTKQSVKLNMKLKFPPINITVNTATIKPEEVIDILNSRLESMR